MHGRDSGAQQTMRISALRTWRHSIVSETTSGRVTFLILFVLIGILAAGFARNSSCLLVSSDGAAWRVMLNVQADQHEPFSQGGVDPYEANFDAWHPVFYEYLLPSVLT